MLHVVRPSIWKRQNQEDLRHQKVRWKRGMGMKAEDAQVSE